MARKTRREREREREYNRMYTVVEGGGGTSREGGGWLALG